MSVSVRTLFHCGTHDHDIIHIIITRGIISKEFQEMNVMTLIQCEESRSFTLWFPDHLSGTVRQDTITPLTSVHINMAKQLKGKTSH